LGIRNELTHCVQHRLRAAGQDFATVCCQVSKGFRDESRLDDHLRVRDERCGLRVPVAAEAQERGWRAELLGEVRERRHADPASDQEWLLDVQPVAVSERAEDVDRFAGLGRCERSRPWPDGL
jgi:hypothetical protein